jgi:hypothetical protein
MNFQPLLDVCKNINKYLTTRYLYVIIVGNMEIYNRAMFRSPESATEWLLKLIVWAFFCTLTWSGRARSCGRKRQTHVTRWLRYWARTVRPRVAEPLGHLAFVIRWERGEIGGLPHCHVLISRFPERSINPSTCFAMKNTWKHGISQVRLYDPYAPGDVSRYVSKGRFSSVADCEGANTLGDAASRSVHPWMSPGYG